MKKMNFRSIKFNQPIKQARLVAALVALFLITGGVYVYSQAEPFFNDSVVVAGEESPVTNVVDFVATNTKSFLNIGDQSDQSGNNNESDSTAMVDSGQRSVITLAGGCFWCTEAFFQEAPGVVNAVSGYAGGEASTATYKQVSSGTSGHREAVQVTYDPARINTQAILDIYWSHIDPTDTGGQFADRGFQYTTAIFYHSEDQRTVAETSKKTLSESGLFEKPIAPLILPYTTFFPAEEYHQDYYKKSADHYERYKKGSGRAGFIEENWAKTAALEFLAAQESDTSE
jgi:methionine-S-sulfoxide reductase